jgi:hypothetical protein
MQNVAGKVCLAMALAAGFAPAAAQDSRGEAANCSYQQSAEADAASGAYAADRTGDTVPALTPVAIRIAAAIDSKTAAIGSCFPITLAEPIVVEGVEVVPIGASGLGQVVHAAKARAGGKGGELILAARFIRHNGNTIPLRSFEFSKAGKDQLDVAVAASATLPMMGYLFSGGNVWVADGTVASAKVRQTVRIPRADAGQGDAVSRNEGNDKK